MLRRLRPFFEKFHPLWDRYERFCGRRLLSAYRRRREAYARRPPASRPPLPARPAKRTGDIHTFCLVPLVGWHDALLPDLEFFGPVHVHDFGKSMPDTVLRQIVDKGFLAWREEANREILRAFENVHARRPVDWLFAYVQSDHILAGTIQQIRDRYGVPTVNLCMDDKNSWDYGWVGGQVAGSLGLIRAFDLWWTTSRLAEDWVRSEGGRAIFLPGGFAASLYPDDEIPYSIPVSFVGSRNAPRADMIAFLNRHGIEVKVFGHGWSPKADVTRSRMIEIYRQSQINLGHGGTFASDAVTNVKGRDFEVPPAGGGVYLTTYNPDLAPFFAIGREILCWHGCDDLLEQVRWLLNRPEACRDMARRARERCRAEHTWRHRYAAILCEIGLLENPAQPPQERLERGS